MARSARRVKIGATLDPELVAAVDRYVDAHPDIDRSTWRSIRRAAAERMILTPG